MPSKDIENLISSLTGSKKKESKDVTELLQAIFGKIKVGTALKGDQGEPGKDGYTPIKNVDYFDGEPGPPGKPGRDAKGDKGDPGKPGKNGKDSPFQNIEEIISQLNSKEEIIKVESIIGYKDLLKPVHQRIEKLEKGSNYLHRKGFLDQRWHGGGSGSGGGGTWGSITGTLSDQTDLQNALDALVPYTGATASVDLGTHNLEANSLLLAASGSVTFGLGSPTQIAYGAWGANQMFILGTDFFSAVLDVSLLDDDRIFTFPNTSGTFALTSNLTGMVTGSGVANRVAFWSAGSVITSDVDFGFDGTTLTLGVPTTPVTTADFVIGVSSNTKTGLVIQTKAGTTLPAFQIQDSAGVVKSSFDTTGNGALRVNYSGTMAAAAYPGFVLSVQNINDAGEGSWIEILNSGGANTGAFFGMMGNQFQLFNWQGGDIEFWTFPTASNGYVRVTISDTGNLGLDGTPQYGWGHGWGGGVGIFGLTNAQTAPTTSLTTALGIYSVSQELWYMSASNQARKVAWSTAALTSGRVALIGTGGALTDDADITFVTDTLTVDKVSVDDDAYGAGWDGSLLVPTRNAVYDKIETLAAPTLKSGTATRTGDTASGNQVIAHGLGKVPTMIRVTALKRNASVGFAWSQGVSNGTTHSYIAYTSFTAGAYDANQGSEFILLGDDDAGNMQYASVSVDATNITLAWTKAGSPTSGQIKLMWEVEG